MNEPSEPPPCSLLIIDDDEPGWQRAVWFLRGRGHNVRTARSAREAAVALERAPVDVLIADGQLLENANKTRLASLIAQLQPALILIGDRPVTTTAMDPLPQIRAQLSTPLSHKRLLAAIDEAAPASSPRSGCGS